jgi:hypothetical protein
MSMLAGSNCAPSRTRFGVTPSIHSVSEFRCRNGLSPSRCSAFTTPPPVSSSAPRSSEISIFGRLRPFR